MRLFRRRRLRLVFYFAGTFAGLVRTLVDHLPGAVLDLAAGNHSAQARWPPQPGAAALPIAISGSQESEDKEQVTRTHEPSAGNRKTACAVRLLQAGRDPSLHSG